MPAEPAVSASLSTATTPPPERRTARPAPRARRRRTAARLFLAFLLVVSLAAALFFYPPAWHAGMRALLGEAAARRGLHLEIGGIEGGPMDGIVLHELSIRPQNESTTGEALSVHLRARRVELILAPPAIPFFARPKPSWLERLVVEGLVGEGSLAMPVAETSSPAASPSGPMTSSDTAAPPTTIQTRWAAWWRQQSRRLTRDTLDRFAPAAFSILNRPGETLTLIRGTDGLLRVDGLQLTGEIDAPGRFHVHGVEARAPGGFANRYEGWHGTTAWRDGRLMVRDVTLAPGVDLTQATLDVAQLIHARRVQGKVTVGALGGELRGEGSVGLASPGRLQVEIAGAMNAVAVRPLAELLGVREPTGGTVRAGQFSFRGNPERLADATGSLRAEAVDFQLGERRWQQLRVGAIVLNHRVTIHDLELVQSGNRLTLNGECPLPSATAGGALPPGWWQQNVSCQVDARLNDLGAFGQLIGPAFPKLAGRMAIRSALTGDPTGGADGGGGLAGTVELEGSRLSVGGAPVGSLRASLRFLHGELEVRALSAEHAGDTVTGKGACRLVGSFRYAGEFKAHVKDLAPYAPALPAAMFPTPPAGAVTLDWSGDGAAQSHNGAFRARIGGFFVKSGPAALPRPVDVDAEGTYSPDSVSFRRLLLRENVPSVGRAANNGPDFQARFENGALPLTQNTDALAAGHFFRPEGALAGRLELRDFALDLLPPLLPAFLASGTDGRVAGWMDLGGTAHEPRVSGALQLRKTRLHWASTRWSPLLDADGVNADLRLEGTAGLLDAVTGERTADGGPFSLSGRVDWTDRATPATLGVALGAKNLRLRDDAHVRVRGDVNVTLLGTSAAPEIAGEIRLREGGRVWHELTFQPVPTESPLQPRELLGHEGPLADANLNLRITSAAPLLLETSAGARGEISLEGRLIGPARQPTPVGGIDLRHGRATLIPDAGALPSPAVVKELEIEAGALYFRAEEPGDPTLALTGFYTLKAERGGRPPAGRLRVDFFGPLSTGNCVFTSTPPRWSAEAVEEFFLEDQPLANALGLLSLAPAALPPAPEPLDSPAAMLWYPALEAAPAEAAPATASRPQKLYLRLR